MVMVPNSNPMIIRDEITMFFQPLFERIAQAPLPPSSILNEKTWSHEIIYSSAVDGSLVRLFHPLLEVTKNLYPCKNMG